MGRKRIIVQNPSCTKILELNITDQLAYLTDPPVILKKHGFIKRHLIITNLPNYTINNLNSTNSSKSSNVHDIYVYRFYLEFSSDRLTKIVNGPVIVPDIQARVPFPVRSTTLIP